jgi:hypothetical protein
MAGASGREAAGPGWAYYVLASLALSVGWGIRGNFGHEYGAMIPGALAAMAVVLLSGRVDWHRRVAYFATFGALGWSFGGSISYMQVVAYTHSGHSPSVLYGFACLFVIGFLWAAPGGAGTALAAFADRDRLTELFAPMTAVFLAWWLQGLVLVPWLSRAGYDLDWFDTDWIAALLAIVAVLALAAARRRLDRATVLILHMAVGWWASFLVLVVALGLRMTPPRGDNWAGCLGLTLGLLVYCLRHGLAPVALAALKTGFAGGIGFASSSMLKLVEVTSGLETNWHSILEQTTGLFNGLAVAMAMAGPIRRAPRASDDPPSRRWTEVYAVGFVLLLITYLNLSKNAGEWVRVKAVPAAMAGLSAAHWFDLAYLALAVAVLVPLVRHLSRPLPLLSASPLGRGQWLFLAFLWWMVVGNFERAVVGFAPQRLVTEGVIHLNAALGSLLLLLSSTPARAETDALPFEPAVRSRLRKTLAVGLTAAAVSVLVDWGVVRAIYGDRFAGYASRHIRFGPNATTSPERSKPQG